MAYLHGGPISTTDYVRTTPEGTPLPPGIYQAVVTKTGQKETQGKNGNPPGIMIEVEFDITSPAEFANSNRKFWDRFNIVNASADAMRIAKEGIGDLALACGFREIEDDEQLQGHEVMMRLVVEEGKDYTNKQGQLVKGRPQNRCLKYWPVGTDVEAAEREAKERKHGAKAAAPQQAANVAPQQATRWGNNAQPQTAPAPAAPAAPAVAQQAPATAAAGNVAPWKRNKQ